MLRCLSACAALAVGTAALYEGIALRSYTLTTPKWKSGKSLRFAVITDLHSRSFPGDRQPIPALLRELRPDHILLAGDIVDEHRPPKHAHTFLQAAARLAPCWYALGNHEYRTYCMPAIARMAQRCGATVLLDESKEIQTPAGKLLIAGCEDPEKTLQSQRSYNWRTSLQKNFAGMGQNAAYTILLAHHPEHAQIYAELGFDLVISGHAHGGQVRIPFALNGLYAPSSGLFPRYAGGCYRIGRTDHVVGRGLVTFRSMPRVFNPPEIVVVDLAGTA